MTDSVRTEGLTSAEAGRRQQQYGKNELTPQKKENFFLKVLHILREPMFLLLIAAAVIYFILGEPRDGAIMLIFVVGIIGIDVAQQWKTDKTLSALRELSAPRVKVVRDGAESEIPSTELVPGDLMLLYEGVKIPADGKIARCSDFCADESTLTGEAEGVWKMPAGSVESGDRRFRKDWCYAGTLVTQGTAAVIVEKTGAATEYGKIGLGVASAKSEQTPLQKQTGRLVTVCAAIAGVLFLLVGVFTWLNLTDHSFEDRLIESVLSGVTLAMAMIPEEFPVILTVFLSMGAWRLAKKHSMVRRLPSVETLGAVSVLCVDKTGTITQNRMTVRKLWTEDGHDERELTFVMGLGCETEAYDPMEKAMLACCAQRGQSAEELTRGELVGEYAFTNKLKMMGHIWRRDGELIIAAKGSPEKIMSICELSAEARERCAEQAAAMAADGLRVIAVASQRPQDIREVPDSMSGLSLTLIGLVGLADPPREGVTQDIAVCRRAGIRVVMITGDNGVTASAIAKKIGMSGCENAVTGDMLDKMSDEQLRETVKTASVFSRVVPEHKMRIVRALKENGEIVAMTGDGVNDAPALKYADIGIAMGRRGSEVSREAADLILMDDNFHTIVETVHDGRRIYDNIRRAVGYVFSIHIPIAFSSLLAPLLGIAPAAMFLLPLHVVLLEILIDPTCSIVLERQPAEENIMERPPRARDEKLLSGRLLIKSAVQGFAVFAAAFGAYFVTLAGLKANAPAARAMGLAVIIFANLFLVAVNSSDRDPALHSMKRLIKDKVMWAVGIGTPALLCAVLYTPLASLLKLDALSPARLGTALALAAASVAWYEIVKAAKRRAANSTAQHG